MSDVIKVNPSLDLVLDRVIDVPVDLVWEAWTKPEHLKEWFTPRPWTVKECELDLRPGGIFRTVMCSPEGQEFPNVGCYLEIVPMKRLVFTSVLLPGYRPAVDDELPFTGVVTMEKQGTGTRYIAMAIHRDEKGREQHEAMGFHQGWGTALEQMVAHIKGLAK